MSNIPENARARRAVSVYLALVFVVASFLWGYRTGTGRASRGPTGSASGGIEIANAGLDRSGGSVDFEQFWDLWNIIKERYVKQPVDEKQMYYGALAGMVASLRDPHSMFFEPKASEEFTQQLSGKFEGIGAEIGVKKEELVIVAPLSGSPAEKAGLKAGDRIVAIDDVDAYGLTLDEAVGRIRGDKGTKVKLMILRDADTVPREFTIMRDTISIESVKLSYATSPRGKRLAVITVSNFNSDTYDRFLDAVTALRARGVDGIVLDLRNNPGGYLDVSVQMLGEWVPGEVVVSERFSDGTKDSHKASGRGRLKDLPTLILVNGGSASASEITAGALQDLNKATLIGTQTFGKGSVQDLIDLSDGSSVKLTIAEWLTPKGNNINVNGIAPNYVVDRSEEDYDNERDPQLDAAKAWFDGVVPPSAAEKTSKK